MKKNYPKEYGRQFCDAYAMQMQSAVYITTDVCPSQADSLIK